MNVITLPEPPVNRREALRYAACPGGNAGDLPFDECLSLLPGQLSCRVCWEEVPVQLTDGFADLGFAAAASAGLAKGLQGCSRAIVFAATVGLGMDRLITRYERVSPVHALLLHGIGAERIESTCDAFCALMNERLAPAGERLRPRYSPGYGDLPLAFQREIFRFLNPEKHIGLTLTPNLTMSPTKSVTAIAGIARGFGAFSPMPKGCSVCSQQGCTFRSCSGKD